MNTVACLLGAVTFLASTPVQVMDSGGNQPRIHAANSFVPDCGIRFHTSCRVTGSRTNWTVTAWALNGTLVAWDTQRETDTVPQVRAIDVNGQAYATAVVQRTVAVAPQTLTMRATRRGGCQALMRVEVR